MFPGLSRTKVIFQDFPGPGIFKKKIHDFPGCVGTLLLVQTKQTIRYCETNCVQKGACCLGGAASVQTEPCQTFLVKCRSQTVSNIGQLSTQQVTYTSRTFVNIYINAHSAD